MSVSKENKIGNLMLEHPSWELFFSEWLRKKGYSVQLVQKYVQNGWLCSLCRGVFYRANKQVLDAYGAMASYHAHVGNDIHIAAHSALEIYGYMHYVPMGKPQMMVAVDGKYIPAWLQQDMFDRQIIPFRSEALPVEHYAFNYQGQMLPISTPERAFMECLLLAPKYYNYLDLYMLMEQLTGLRPMVVQQLLEQVSSYRAKRMFIYMAEKANHAWWEEVDISHIDMGSSKIYYSPTGKYISKYKITIPAELYDYE